MLIIVEFNVFNMVKFIIINHYLGYMRNELAKVHITPSNYHLIVESGLSAVVLNYSTSAVN